MEWILYSMGVFLLVLILQRYFEQRDQNFEDRYMALYGATDWESCNMELRLSFEREKDQYVKETFFSRLDALLKSCNPFGSLFHEQGNPHIKGVDYTYSPSIRYEDLLSPRNGIYFHNLDIPGQLTVIWNHIQSDGVRLWRSIKPLFDTNAAILEFNNNKMPLAFIPEIISFPITMWRLRFRSNVKADTSNLTYGYRLWKTDPIKEIKNEKGISFNIVSSAMILEELFLRHPECKQLTVGITVAFTFLKSKNQYGIITLRIKRGNFEEICKQITKKTKHPTLVWGTFSVQSYLLSLTPDQMFKKLMGYFRRQIDVLISSLPCGKNPAEIDGIPIKLSCYPKELTIPYYFLLMGTGPHIHLSYTSKFEQSDAFMDQPILLNRVVKQSESK